ncbi:hypothetical protein CHELA1G2_14158 [Hyphomicrobiales bacterium]|nr:hypothetical protein CHELA1G2_14158 [Hyphomicrobiales bacterium]
MDNAAPAAAVARNERRETLPAAVDTVRSGEQTPRISDFVIILSPSVPKISGCYPKTSS